MKETSASRLAQLIASLETNATEFAKANDIPKSSLSLYLSGKRTMKQDRIGQLAYKYNVNPAWLMGYDVPVQWREPQDAAIQDFNLLSKYHKLSDRDKLIIVNMIDTMLGESQ